MFCDFVIVIVMFSDINDNKFIFFVFKYFFIILEDSLINFVVGILIVLDKDMGINLVISFFIVFGEFSFDFIIDLLNVVLKVNFVFNVLLRSLYVLIV